MSPAKIGEQHDYLHTRWHPHDCCLCGKEQKVIRLSQRIAELEAKVEQLQIAGRRLLIHHVESNRCSDNGREHYEAKMLMVDALTSEEES